jgi:Uma2 family endonuclease
MVATAELAPDDDKLYEIAEDGQLEEKEMAGARHGGVGVRLVARMLMHVEANQLGGVYGPDTSFTIGSRERMPDVAFVSAARIPAAGEPENAWPLAPDLAVEIISPNDAWEKVNRKLREYFAADVREVWLISLEQRSVIIHHSPTNPTQILIGDDELTSANLLPGLRCCISELFKQPAHRAAQD